MSFDSTMKFSNTMNRAEIEAMLGECRAFAAAADLPEGVRRRARAIFRLIAEAEAAWTPTGMTTLRGTATRSVEDAGQEGIAGFTYTAGRLTLDHEYLRNVVLSAAVGLQRAEFLNGGGTQIGRAHV